MLLGRHIIMFAQNVDLYIGALGSTVITVRALIGLLSGVSSDMAFQVTCLLESRSVTEGTLEVLRFPSSSAVESRTAPLLARNT